jgi:hypothetical protein
MIDWLQIFPWLSCLWACEMAAEASSEPPSTHVISAETSIVRIVRNRAPKSPFLLVEKSCGENYCMWTVLAVYTQRISISGTLVPDLWGTSKYSAIRTQRLDLESPSLQLWNDCR